LRGRRIELFVGILETSTSHEDFDTDILYDDPLVVVADARHPLSRRRSIALADLVNEAWALPPVTNPAGSYVRDAFPKNGLAVPNRIVSTYSTILRHNLVATARFITVLPKSMLPVMARNLSLKALPVDLPGQHRQMAVVALRNRSLSPISQLFIKTVRAVATPRTRAKTRAT
jgi:DNA-binding transcriptional LysR family regulator